MSRYARGVAAPSGLGGCTGGCGIKLPHFPNEMGCTAWPIEREYATSPVFWRGADPSVRSPNLPTSAMGASAQFSKALVRPDPSSPNGLSPLNPVNPKTGTDTLPLPGDDGAPIPPWSGEGVPGSGSGWEGWSACAQGNRPTWGWNRQPPGNLPPPRTAPWLQPDKYAPPYGGEPMGAADLPGNVAGIVEEIKRLLNLGPQQFARFMVNLIGIANDFKEARDRMMQIPSDEAAIAAYGADQGYKATMGIYHALGNVVYAAWPDIGLQGARLGNPLILAIIPLIIQAGYAIAAIIGAWSLFSWVDTAHQTAAANRTLADTAQRTCADDPNSPACVEALRTAAKGVPPAPNVIGDALGSLGKIVMWGALAFLGVKLIGMINEERKARRPALVEAAA